MKHAIIGDAGADGILRAAGAAMLVASGVALLGAVTSATRPGLAARVDPAGVRSADRSAGSKDDA